MDGGLLVWQFLRGMSVWYAVALIDHVQLWEASAMEFEILFRRCAKQYPQVMSDVHTPNIVKTAVSTPIPVRCKDALRCAHAYTAQILAARQSAGDVPNLMEDVLMLQTMHLTALPAQLQGDDLLNVRAIVTDWMQVLRSLLDGQTNKIPAGNGTFSKEEGIFIKLLIFHFGRGGYYPGQVSQ